VNDFERRLVLLGGGRLAPRGRVGQSLDPEVISRMWRTASTTLPVPASPLERIIAAPSPIRPQCLAKVGRSANEGTSKASFVNVVALVGRGQHLGLVDVVDFQRFQDLGLGKVADPRLAMTESSPPPESP